jgi:amino acid transporter
MVIATAANWIYAELAGMFPERSGGIALYAAEGWRSRMPLIGPLATFGYWFAWSSSMAVYSLIIGDLVVGEWFPGSTWSVALGPVDVTLPRVLAALVLILVWAANVLGWTPTMWLAYATAAMLLVPLGVFVVAPLLADGWSTSSFTGLVGGSGAWGGWKLAVVWLYVMCWTSLGVEACAVFTPEYRGGARDSARALRASALFSLAIFVLLPLGAVGSVGEGVVADDPLTFYVEAFDATVGGTSGVMIALLVGSLLLVITTCAASSSRALHGAAAQGLTVRELEYVNRHGAPSRALAVDLVINLGLVFLLGSTLAIVAAGNLGYIAAHVFALVAFVLLRRDRPDAARPLRAPRGFVPLGAALAALLAFVLVVGATSFDLTGYGGGRELATAFAILGSSLTLYGYRRFAQDRRVHPEDASIA